MKIQQGEKLEVPFVGHWLCKEKQLLLICHYVLNIISKIKVFELRMFIKLTKLRTHYCIKRILVQFQHKTIYLRFLNYLKPYCIYFCCILKLLNFLWFPFRNR